LLLDLHTHLEPRRRRIAEQLAAYLDAESDVPAELLAAMRYSLLAPGKRIRPILVLLAAEACGGSVEDALPAACAVEMIHAYSLIHDDLPAMDDDDLRRGQPTCHKKFGEATAILAGDALLTLAFQTIAEGTAPPDLAAVCCGELARAAGMAGMVGGQMADLEWEKRPQGTAADLVAIHGKKTGALFRAALRLGGLIGCHQGAPARRDLAEEAARLDALDRYAACLGLAFQISDDLLDVESTSAQTGKRVGKDAERGKLTYPGLLGVEESRRRLTKVCQDARAHVSSLGQNAEYLIAVVDTIESRDK
jgi:geranylgeranyl diphosphate synthase type II